MQSIGNCLFIKGKEMTQAGENFNLRLLLLFRLIEKEFSNKRWKFLQEALFVGERINDPGRSTKENCQKITQTREILCKILDKKEFSGVKVMVKGDGDSLVWFGETSLRISIYREYGNSLWNCTGPSCLGVLELEAASENNGIEIQVKKEGTGNRK